MEILILPHLSQALSICPALLLKLPAPQPSLAECLPSSSTPAKAIDGVARKKTAELEKNLEEMTIWCSRMEQMLMQLMVSQFSIDSYQINRYIFQMNFYSETTVINRQKNQEK